MASLLDWEASANKIVSSAYWMWDTYKPDLSTSTPESRFSDLAFSINKCNPSATIKNKNGDSGSPWRNPYLILISSVGEPLMRIETDVVVKHSLIQWIQVEWKPNFSIISNKKFHRTQSKAFSKSTLNAKLPVEHFFIRCSISLHAIVLSKMFLPTIKADWTRLIIFGIIDLSLLARHFESIL